jgi:hypothetical protein
MNKRILAASLWLFAGWHAGAVLAAFVGLPEAAGVVPGIAIAAFVAGDPLHRIWTPTRPIADRT